MGFPDYSFEGIAGLLDHLNELPVGLYVYGFTLLLLLYTCGL
jgi:hypothetical protein